MWTPLLAEFFTKSGAQGTCASPAKVYRVRMRGDGDSPKEGTRRDHRSEQQKNRLLVLFVALSSSQEPQAQDMYR